MKERPILFSGPMVRAILAGAKTQTRRVVKPQHDFSPCMRTPEYCAKVNPYGQPADRLWVKETSIIAPKRFATPDDTCRIDSDGDPRFVQYIASHPNTEAAGWYKLKKSPSIFMPRWASRITLEIESVRVERLQEISREDAIAEGIESREVSSLSKPLWRDYSGPHPVFGPDPIRSYRSLWESINGKDSWPLNPWVWVVTFKRITQPAKSEEVA